MAQITYRMNLSKNLFLFILVITSLISNAVVKGNSIRLQRHVGVFFRHFEPIVENPSIFEPIPTEESDSTTIAPDNSTNLTEVTTTPDPKSPLIPTTTSSNENSTEVPNTAKTDPPLPNTSDVPLNMPANSEMPDAPPTDTPVSENTTDPVPVPDSKSADNESATTMTPNNQGSDPNVSQKPEDTENLAQKPSTEGKPSEDGLNQPTELPTGGTSPSPSILADQTAQDSSSTTPNPKPKAPETEGSTSADSNPEPETTSPTLADESNSTQMPATSTPDKSEKPGIGSTEAPKPNLRNPKKLDPKDPSDTTEIPPTTNPSMENPEPTSSPDNSDKSQPTTISPGDLKTTCPTVMPRSESEITNTKIPNSEVTTPKSSELTTTMTSESSTEQPSPPEPTKPRDSSSEPESDEDLAAIAQLLDKLNQQKKTLSDQIQDSRKALDSITEVLNNDKNRKVNDVINKAEEEEVKPLADELNENPADIGRVLDPVVISNANETQKNQAKQWIIARITIPAQFQLMQSYLGLKMASPNVTFPQRVGVMSLFSETHVDCIRNGEYQLRGPLEAMIVKLACITKSTDPGKLPNGWQPNNYLNRGAMDQIRDCSQPDFFYSTNPYGRNTIIFRRIQDNYQEGLGVFQNIQKTLAQQLNLASQEVVKMQQQCERQRQLQMESEQVPQLSNQYLPVKQRWNTQEEVPAPSMSASAPSGQWVVGNWRPSIPNGYRTQRWSRQI